MVVATARRPTHPTPPDSLRVYVEQAEQSFRRHLGLCENPAEAYTVVVGSRAPFDDDDVVAAVVRAVTVLYHETMTTWRAPAPAPVAPPPVVDANGDPVPGGIPTGADPAFYRAWMATRVPAASCPHYVAVSEAAAGFSACERCR